MKDVTEDTKYTARYRIQERYYDTNRNSYLKRVYGITLKEYNDILKSQSYSCASCGNADAGTRSKFNTFCVDHNHKTGKVRGLLCSSCNRAVVPTVEYYESRIAAAIKYLQKK
jgi:hypothetical protein